MAKNNSINDILPYIAICGLLLIGLPILRFTGLIKNQSDVDANAILTGNAFDPKFWKKGGAGTLILTDASAKFLAQSVYDSKGFFNDDEDKLYGVFKSLKTKSQVSYLADVFQHIYKRDMITYINSFMNNNELSVLKKIVDGLPNFKK
jgi:hypothetical protein